MSAFVVEDKTINRVVSWLADDREMEWYLRETPLNTVEDRQTFGKNLFDMNVAGVDARYGLGQAETFRPLDYDYKYELTNPMQAYKSLSCLLYQCSEGKVFETDLFKLMEKIKWAIAAHIISKMPSYEKAEWA